jgi:hypothetical protein
MTRIIVDETLRNKLGDLTGPIELCDKEGHVLGRFTPAVDPVLYEGMVPEISKEELEKRRQSKQVGKSYTTDEVIAHLEKQ